MPPDANETVAYSSLGGLLDHLGQRGADVRSFCAQLQIPSIAPSDPDTRVSIPLLQKAWGLAYATTGDPALALRVGAGTTVSSLGVAGLLAVHCETVEEALRSICRYFILLSGGMSISVQLEGDRAVAALDSDGTPAESWRFVVERTLASAVAILAHETNGQGQPAWAEFSFPAPMHVQKYHELICPDCRFDAGRDALVFASEVFELRLGGRNPRLHGLLRREADEAINQLGGNNPVGRGLREQLPELLGRGLCTASAVARAIGLSERTLQRRLSAEGTSFQKILDEVRHEHCLKLLSGGRFSVEQIAFTCGFDETSGFYRAFRRWTGKTPSAFRKPRVIGV